jgi:hypothetical protein
MAHNWTDAQVKKVLAGRKVGKSWLDLMADLKVNGTMSESAFVLSMRPRMKELDPTSVRSAGSRKAKVKVTTRKISDKVEPEVDRAPVRQALVKLQKTDNPDEVRSLLEGRVIEISRQIGKVTSKDSYKVKSVRRTTLIKDKMAVEFTDSEQKTRVIMLSEITRVTTPTK